MKLVGIGLAIGTAISFVIARLAVGMLAGLSAADPVTFVGTAAILMAVGIGACYVPRGVHQLWIRWSRFGGCDVPNEEQTFHFRVMARPYLVRTSVWKRVISRLGRERAEKCSRVA